MSQLLIQISSIFKSFGSHRLFDEMTLSINAGDRLALIGENGSGKTTLLHLLSGSIQPDSGYVQRSSGLTIGLLPQEVIHHPEMMVRHYLKGPLMELEQRMASLQDLLDDPEKLAYWGDLHEEYERRGGYRTIPLEEVLYGLKIRTQLDQPMGSLSSGHRIRVALAKILMNNPDLLLLDEPTNHLDQEMIAWLQEKLVLRKGATVTVSHDRKFLNETCSHLIEIQNSHLTFYGGSYDFYLEERERLIEREVKAYEEQKEERIRLKQKIKALSFSKPKASPLPDRNLMAYDKRGEHHQKSVQRTLNELKARLKEIEAKPLSHPKPKGITGLKFTSMPLTSAVAIEFENVSKSFEQITLFSGVTKVVKKNDRIIIKGPNGSGKTTFLQCVAGSLSIDSGIIRRCSSARIAFLDQEVATLPINLTPLDYFSIHFGLSEEGIRRELHKAALGNFEILTQPFSILSVGQRKRLMLLSLILEKPNILLLDEPTNHLDFLTLEAFEKALFDFDGAIIAISHDQTFTDKLATDIWKWPQKNS